MKFPDTACVISYPHKKDNYDSSLRIHTIPFLEVKQTRLHEKPDKHSLSTSHAFLLGQLMLRLAHLAMLSIFHMTHTVSSVRLLIK